MRIVQNVLAFYANAKLLHFTENRFFLSEMLHNIGGFNTSYEFSFWLGRVMSDFLQKELTSFGLPIALLTALIRRKQFEDYSPNLNSTKRGWVLSVGTTF